LTDDQLFGFFSVPRHEDGSPDLPRPFGDDADLTPESVYKRHLWLNGITSKAKQDQMWIDERERRRARHHGPNRAEEPAARGGFGVDAS
jgi:hypothetical protein